MEAFTDFALSSGMGVAITGLTFAVVALVFGDYWLHRAFKGQFRYSRHLQTMMLLCVAVGSVLIFLALFAAFLEAFMWLLAMVGLAES
jgi:hypothetical protein